MALRTSLLATAALLATTAAWGSAPAALTRRQTRWATATSSRGGAAPLQATTEADAAATTADGETYEFQAEVSRVMEIIINSLYSDRDVFLRELVSNAADACDKRRFLSVSDGNTGATDDLRIRIKADRDARTLTIEDTGVGMSKDELVNNLGRIAQSGTAKFVEALGSGEADVSLIGQFGVGFYSAYLVANSMAVVTKNFNGDGVQRRWQSEAGSSFTVADDTDGEPLEGTSGARLILNIKEDCDEYLDEYKLRELLQRYSEFITFPIELWTSKTEYDQVPDEDADPPAEGEEPKMKSVPRQVEDWELMNKQKPTWLRSPKEVNETEYTEFYRTAFKAYDTPMAHTHFSLEGQVEFKSLLYVPSVLPYELSRNMFDETSRSIKLYVKRVFINDKFEELVPRWLTFLRGIVDSDDLPLNVGREILQKSKMLSVINKRLVRKSIDMFRDIQENGDYKTFWNNYGRYLKVGILESEDIKDDLAPLLRFYSSSSSTNYTSFDEYVSRMKTNQTQIFYISGDSKAQVEMSPVLEKLTKKGYEVIYLTEPLDELMAQSLSSYDDRNIVDASKDTLDLPEDESEAAKEEKEKAETELESLLAFLQETLGDRVSKCAVSTDLVESPAALVQGAYGMSPTMARYMKAQAVSMGEDEEALMQGMGASSKPTLEINPTHPIVTSLRAAVDAKSDTAKATADLLFDVASLLGGYTLSDPAGFASRVTTIMSNAPAAAPGPGGVSDAEVL